MINSGGGQSHTPESQPSAGPCVGETLCTGAADAGPRVGKVAPRAAGHVWAPVGCNDHDAPTSLTRAGPPLESLIGKLNIVWQLSRGASCPRALLPPLQFEDLYPRLKKVRRPSATMRGETRSNAAEAGGELPAPAFWRPRGVRVQGLKGREAHATPVLHRSGNPLVQGSLGFPLARGSKTEPVLSAG